MIPTNIRPVEINIDHRSLSEHLPGMPITRSLLAMVENEIVTIERERDIRRDLSFKSEELALLRAYLQQMVSR